MLSDVFKVNLGAKKKEDGGAMTSFGSRGFFRLEDFPSAHSFSLLVNYEIAHGGTLVSPPIGIAMGPLEQFSKGNHASFKLVRIEQA